MKNAIKAIGYVLLALLFATQLLAVAVTPMPEALIHGGFVLVIGLWAAYKFNTRQKKVKSED